ncbi:E3 ubiquitin-protein ligase TRIM56-like [Watersipora subatra]|uniref:E3 ubiquitin-protein ligase TRIM56-like n=1 Tax=Watersipora subatra TaxID=2589382 RepID=UPI00355B9295
MDMTTESVVCGYCLEKDEQLIDPRSLPCHHVHCYPCLVGDFEANRIVRCGTCKAVFDVTLARLPSAENRNNDILVCDMCVDNKTEGELAASYCTTCSKKMCAKHLELHHQLFTLHRDVLDIKDYQLKAQVLVERYCDMHPDKPITIGCSTCFQVLCLTCLDCTKECADGVNHTPVTLEKLVKLLKDRRDKVKVEALAKEGELATLLKRSTKVLTDYEKKTLKLVDQLHKSRDKELSELRRRYDELERELIDNRRTSKEQLVEFIERDIGVRMTEINTLLLLQDAKFKDSHQVDIVNSFTDAYPEIRRLFDEALPSLTLTNQKTLLSQAKMQELEVQMVDDAAITVHLLSPPTSLELKKEIPVGFSCHAVTHSKKFTNAGGDGPNLYRIHESANSVTLLTSLEGKRIDDLCVYNDRLCNWR